MDDIPRGFKGIWIPKEVWLDHSLTYFEKCLLAEIESLDKDDGCFASNEYLAKFFNERERKIQEGLSKLKSKGYIYQESFDGRKRILKANLTPNKDKSLFNMSDMRKEENMESDKSLFNTSAMLNSAPLPCGIPHVSLYIENKEEKKQQQQAAEKDAAAVSFFSEKKQDKTKIYKSLETLVIDESEKIEISGKYDEAAVNHAVQWAIHPETKLNKSLAPAIKWACQAKPEIPKNKQDEIDHNKMSADSIIKKLKKVTHARIDVNSTEVEIVFIGAQKESLITKFSDKGFLQKLENNLKKAGYY